VTLDLKRKVTLSNLICSVARGAFTGQTRILMMSARNSDSRLPGSTNLNLSDILQSRTCDTCLHVMIEMLSVTDTPS
jgi:hypothetical protein